MQELLEAVWLEGLYTSWVIQRGCELDRETWFRRMQIAIRLQERNRVYN